MNIRAAAMSTPCPLCCAAIFAQSQFGLLRCEGCGLIVAESVWRPTANEQLNEAFFGETYEPVSSFWVRMFETLNNRRTLRRLRRANCAAGGELLEIGVGTGSLLVDAKAEGYIPFGCDLSEGVCSRVERRTGIVMHCGSIDSLPADQLFDVVVMNHVLEHVSEPVALLEAARRHLRPGGLLHLAVPNVGSWDAHLPGWNSYEPYHLLYFTPRTVRLAVESAGFEIHRLTTHESFSGWFLAIVRMLLRQRLTAHHRQPRERVKQSTSPAEHTYRLAMVTWGALTLPFRRLQELFGKGDEVILLGRSPIND